LRLGVIGAGAFARACHVPALLGHPHADVVMICGRHRGRTEALAAELGIPSFTLDAAELCASEQLDAVTVCTPNDAHAGHVLLALDSGKHVFCEKPLALTVDEATRMVRMARARRVVNQVGFTFRHLFGIQQLQRRVRQGDIGEPLLMRLHHQYFDGVTTSQEIRWQHRRAFGGGVLRDSASHLFDLARFVLGPVTAIRADLRHAGRPDVETEDVASVGLCHTSGAGAECFASRITPAHRPNFVEIVGRDGALSALISRGAADALTRTGASGWQEVSLPPEAADGRPHALDRMMHSFVDACLQGHLGEGSASFDDGLAVQQMIDAAEQAACSRDWMRVEVSG